MENNWVLIKKYISKQGEKSFILQETKDSNLLSLKKLHSREGQMPCST